jgi:SCY1-like protein 2
MDVLNRLKSAVTTVLPVGNPITGEYEIIGQKASGGPGMMWKIFDGVQRNTKQVHLY